MKLWFISQRVNTNYDTYDSAVVAAETEEDARQVHPGYAPYFDGSHVAGEFDPTSDWSYRDWARPYDVEAVCVGEGPIDAGTVICASFNAG